MQEWAGFSSISAGTWVYSTPLHRLEMILPLPLLLSPLLLIPSISAAALSFNQLPLLQPLQQPGSSSPTDYPYRDLPWGPVNILHTTDTHGWLLGHQRQESSFSGDWGDLYSFVTRMKEEAKRRGVDLLLVDSGDRVDGNGLVDGEPPGHEKGYTAMKFFQEMPYDVITTGNHELYKYSVALSTYENLAAHYGDRYLTSNVNITLGTSKGLREVPSGYRFRKFKTEQGRNVTAFGPLFFFKAHAPGITIQKPSEMVEEKWFQDALLEEPDFFLLVGHMSIQVEPDSEWRTIFNAIRLVHSFTPILIFGGHHHIRDCIQEDLRSMSLASGRYMETIGFMSVSGFEKDPTEPLDFSRRYLDQNRNTYKYHAGEDFDTSKGIEISQAMGKVARGFNLTYEFGEAPQAYYLARYSHTSHKSLLNLMVSEVLPTLIDRPDRPFDSITILNSGSIRFDVFKGPFTRNDQWIILPFTNNFEYIPSVPLSVARKLLRYLNLVGEHGVLPSVLEGSPSAIAADVELQYRKHELYSFQNFDFETLQREDRTFGYVTLDRCEGLGDDVRHKPLPHCWQPTFVSTKLPETEDEFVDVVFFDFIQPDILNALNHLQKVKEFTDEDVGLYITSLSANTLMQEYATIAWN